MPDLVANLAFRLLESPLDPVPRFRLLRDVLQWPSDHPDLLVIKEQAMQSQHVLDLAASQLPDGSWGRFRQVDNWPVKRAGHTTETALIRSHALGMEQEHPTIRKAIGYLEGVLRQPITWSDAKSLAIGGVSGLELAVAARLCQLDAANPVIQPIIRKWQDILSACLTDDGIDRAIFYEIHEQYFGYSDEPELDQLLSAYLLILLRDHLEYPVAVRLTNFLINHSRGIYLINTRALRHLPLRFQSRECQRYLVALDFLADYPSAGTFLEKASDWIWEQVSNDGFWDFGLLARDGLELPLSESWRRQGSRQVDCTVRMLCLMVRLQKTCEIRKAICHVL